MKGMEGKRKFSRFEHHGLHLPGARSRAPEIRHVLSITEGNQYIGDYTNWAIGILIIHYKDSCQTTGISSKIFFFVAQFRIATVYLLVSFVILLRRQRAGRPVMLSTREGKCRQFEVLFRDSP